MKHKVALILTLTLLAIFSFAKHARAQGVRTDRSRGPVITGKVYAFEKIADGVYYTTSDSPMATGGNHTIIVGNQNVFLVDAGTTPAAARALLADGAARHRRAGPARYAALRRHGPRLLQTRYSGRPRPNANARSSSG